MARNPFKDSSKKARRHSDDFALDIARVKYVKDDDNHQVVVEIVSGAEEGPEKMPAMVPADGDIAIPSKGEMVVVGYARGQKPIVLGTIYSRQAAPKNYSADERVIQGDGGVFIEGPFGVVPRLDNDPQSPPDGAVWYRTDLDEYRGVEGGQTVSFNTTAV